MRRQGPITSRHILFAVLVVVVINAQLTWWIVFILRLNKEDLDLKRQRLMGAAAIQAARVSTDLETAHTALKAALVMGDRPGLSSVPKPFVGWRTIRSSDPCRVALLNTSGVVELSVTSGDLCVSGVLTHEWAQRVLEVGPELEIVDTDAVGAVGLPLDDPFSDLTVRPKTENWDQLLDEYRRRIVMMISEGGFFAVLLLILVALLWRTFRREIELERQHRNFLSAITHELKSPLASMRLALETVTGGRASDAESQRFLGNALEDTERLQDLVEKVLETTRFTEGWAEFDLRNRNLSNLIRDSIDVFSRRALASGARMETQIAPDVYAEIDAEAMAIVVSNLLENAVKYGGEPPLIEIDFIFDGSEAVIEVADNGIGIADEDLELVFGRFYRSGDEMTRTSSGTGLGLYLVQQIVEAHRGRVEVASTGVDGSTFRVTLPAHEE